MRDVIHPEYTDHLGGAPDRRHWPLMLLLGVGAEAVIASMAIAFMVMGMLFTT